MERFFINKDVLKDVCVELRQRGYSNEELAIAVNFNMRNAIYTNISIPSIVLEKLESLIGRKIDWKILSRKIINENIQIVHDIFEFCFHQLHLIIVMITSILLS